MKKLQRLHKTLFALPPEVFKRLGGKETEQEAAWTCEVCGPITPRSVANGFLPGRCACQERYFAEQQRLRQKAEQEAVRQALFAKCWNWLGETRPREHALMTLETFQAENQMQHHALDVALDFLDKPANLILWSKTYGSGKTHVATAICNQMQHHRGWKCLFAASLDLFRAIEARWDSPSDYPDTASDLVRRAAGCDLLVLDDLGRIGKYRKELDEIIDARHNRGKPTILTLNAERVRVTEQEITGVSCYIGQAASDRMCDEAVGGLVLCEMSGPSWRRRKRQTDQTNGGES